MTEASVTGSLLPPLRERRREALRAAGVYLVTEEALSAGRRSEAVVAAALEAGVRVIQVREKEGAARRALEIARAARLLTRQYDALLLVNDRIDLALAVDADGVHLGQGDLPIDVARRLLGPDALVGLSITAVSQLTADDAGEADYLGVGAVFPTGSKRDATLTGLPLLSSARAAQAAPIIAIGGIAVDNAAVAVRAGADGVAVISAITEAPDPLAAARRLLAVVGEVRAASAFTTGPADRGRLGCAGLGPNRRR
jgi:thiamine-phosphate diphosphorylase